MARMQRVKAYLDRLSFFSGKAHKVKVLRLHRCAVEPMLVALTLFKKERACFFWPFWLH